jgi:arylsulfatase A-like enzyme
VPLLIRGPGVPAGSRRRQLVANVDLAPTIVTVTGVRPARLMDGVSLLALARNPRLGIGRALLLEGPVRRSKRVTVSFVGVRTARYKYVEYATGEKELYDLARDPHELKSLASSRAHASVRAKLAARLRALRHCRGSSCRGVRVS